MAASSASEVGKVDMGVAYNSQVEASSEKSKIKACDRTESGVYTKVNEHFGSGA